MTAERDSGVVLLGSESAGADRRVRQLADADLLGQLLERRGRLRELGDEGGDIKLDWVDGVEQALQHPEWLAELAGEARDILDAGIRHIIWSGMGGSVQTVYCLKRMGYLDLPGLSIHPLDSTDPASLNRVLTEIAALEQIDLGSLVGEPAALRAAIRRVLETTMITGVSMGMTSEEPITHLQWFDGLLREYGIASPEQHLQVMTLPDSYLDRFAQERHARMVPIQLDGESHTPGRMSAPATRVFLRPVALALEAERRAGSAGAAGRLDMLLRRCQQRYGVSHGESVEQRRARTESDPFIRLGAYMADEAITRRRNKVVLVLPSAWRGLGPWIEQLVEESLGKGGKGWLVFYDQDLLSLQERDDCVFLVLQPSSEPEPQAAAVAALRQAGRPVLTLQVNVEADGELPSGLPALAGLFASWKLAVAAFGYLNDIVVVGQPGVEGYKAYARELRDGPGAITFGASGASATAPATDGLHVNTEAVVAGHPDRWQAIAGILAGKTARQAGPAEQVAAIIAIAQQEGWLRYLDVTYNGEVDQALQSALEAAREGVGAQALKMPVKLRTGPSDYHSTEQSETDGPPELVSIRIIALRHEAPIAGAYTDRFLLAQARGTWAAMRDAGRWVLMVTLPDSTRAAAVLRQFFATVATGLAH
jgi:glucose-6-phosphate isomerase